MLESFGYEAHRGHQKQELFGLKSGTYQTDLFKPMIGLLNQPKYISLKYVPLTIELELDSDKEANIVTPMLPHNIIRLKFPTCGKVVTL